MVYDLIIIGGGPAGATAGIYAGRQRLKTLLIAKDFGGQVAKKAVMIENYPGFKGISGMDLIQKFIDQLKEQEVEIKKEEVAKVGKKGDIFFVLTKDKNEYEAAAVILASGSDPRPLEVPGEKEFLGRGLSYCVTCDGPVFKDKNIAVIGGGNAGFEAGIFMLNYAKKIYILEFSSAPKADMKNQETAKKSGKIEIITNACLKKIEGGRFVKSIVYQDTKTKEEKKLSVEGIFVEIGYHPATSYIKGLVDFNEKDEIKVEFETYQTKTPGLFAAGDVNTGKFKQITTACGEGAKAALAAYNFIKSNSNYDK